MAALVAFAILISLGNWQVRRLHWKEALLSDIETRRTAAVALPLEDIRRMVADGQDVDYRRATASGHFLNDKERHFLSTYQGEAGFNVYTPLALDDGRYLFVNRGFVPYDLKAPDKRAAGLPADAVTVTGLARGRLAAKPSSLVPDNDAAKNIFYWKDLDGMAASVGLPSDKVLPFFIDADDTPVPGGWPKGGVTLIDLPNSHLEYAITWYGLALALAGVCGYALLRRRR
ncbi:SURF1 family protein [Rhizobium halophytocola]|nr:SURF1 family protein [Rhizobium halophytocola]